MIPKVFWEEAACPILLPLEECFKFPNEKIINSTPDSSGVEFFLP
jgi:hypothetical protein